MIHETSQQLVQTALQAGVSTFPVSWLRSELRQRLQPGPAHRAVNAPTLSSAFKSVAQDAIVGLARSLRNHAEVQLLLGFPAAPFILPLATRDKRAFLRFAMAHPSHRVLLRRSSAGESAEWSIEPAEDRGRYRLTFSLPEGLEAWIAANEETRRSRTHMVKDDLLSDIMVYYYIDDGVRTCQLRYERGQLRR
jgi:hypothetical protein